MSKVGLGVVGVGAMGKHHAENLRRAVPGARLVAVADADRERARQVAAELEVDYHYGSIEALVERKDIQAVVIASPAKFHAGAIQLAAAAGKDILCEKPLTLTLEEADGALAAVEKARVRLQVGHMRRYDPAYADAKKRIEAGEIGDPVVFKAIGRDREPPPLSYFEAGLNGMLFLDSSIHEFDLARWLMNDEVAEVHAFGGILTFPELAQFGDIDAGVVNLRFSRGAIGNVESFRQARYGYDIRTEIVGSKGTIQVGYLRQTPQLVLTGAGASHDVVSHWLERFADAYLNEVRDFVQTILAGRPPRVTGKDGREALAVALAAQLSCRESRPIMLLELSRVRRSPAAS
ncbi:MAG TPA: Gfo/Idh/MocA family oxidoreductase [Candidatus Acidoferrales bacterium]